MNAKALRMARENNADPINVLAKTLDYYRLALKYLKTPQLRESTSSPWKRDIGPTNQVGSVIGNQLVGTGHGSW
jgi:hypothetical protein